MPYTRRHKIQRGSGERKSIGKAHNTHLKCPLQCFSMNTLSIFDRVKPLNVRKDYTQFLFSYLCFLWFLSLPEKRWMAGARTQLTAQSTRREQLFSLYRQYAHAASVTIQAKLSASTHAPPYNHKGYTPYPIHISSGMRYSIAPCWSFRMQNSLPN